MTRAALALVTLPLLLACGGGGDGGGGTEPDLPTLTTLAVDPAAPTLFTVAPANTVTIATLARDQRGAALTGGTVAYTSDAPNVATVDATGLVTARGAGTARITATVTIGGVTRSAQALVGVVVAPATAIVSSVQNQFTPQVVDIAAGGTVTFNSAAFDHEVRFSTPGSPDDIVPLAGGASVTRTFPTSGTFVYACSLHSGQIGTVRVH